MAKKSVIREFNIYNPISISEGKIQEQFKTILTPEQEKQIYNNVVDKLGEPHPFDYNLIEGIIKKFGLVNAIIDKYVDFTIGPKLRVECKDERGQKILDDFINNTDLRAHIRPWVREALGYGSGYLEIAGLDANSNEVQIKHVSAKSMYIKRDEKGTTIGFVQYGGKSFISISEKDIIPLTTGEIVQLNINKWGSCGYGLGIVYSALQIIDDFLMTQKSIHKLTKRKANAPIHARLGNAEKDDYPQQAQIDAFGNKLQYLDESTEWVTGPNVEFKVIDFGNIGDKFTEILNNDYKLMSYSFQVPEPILGAGNVAEGLVDTQMDGFNRKIKSLQDEIGYIIKIQVLKRILNNAGLDLEFDVFWGELNDEIKAGQIELHKNILSVAGLSPGMRDKVEEKLAELLNINYDEVVAKNDEANDKMEKQLALQQGQTPEQKPTQSPERQREETEPLPEVPGQKSLEHIHEDINLDENFTLTEWLNFDYSQLKDKIISAIAIDKFSNLRANNKIERELGYLNTRQVNQLRNVMKDAFDKEKSIKYIENGIMKKVKIGALKNEKGDVKLNAQLRANMIARSESTRLANIGTLDFYKEKEIEKTRFVASLSERTCDICEELNGTIYEINEAYDKIPVHSNCRCAMVPFIQEKKEGEIKE